MEKSILKSTKKILGLSPDYTAFDMDVLTWINAACSTLRSLGLGPDGLFIEDDSTEWSEFEENNEDTNLIKTYIYLRTRIMFDPPTQPHVLAAFQAQIQEQEFRLSANREDRDWVDPTAPTSREVEA